MRTSLDGEMVLLPDEIKSLWGRGCTPGSACSNNICNHFHAINLAPSRHLVSPGRVMVPWCGYFQIPLIRAAVFLPCFRTRHLFFYRHRHRFATTNMGIVRCSGAWMARGHGRDVIALLKHHFFILYMG